MADLTDEELDRIEARTRAASPGPWEAFTFANPNDQSFIRTGGFDDSQPDMYIHYWLGADEVPVPAADLDFVANARQDLPALVTEVRRLRALLDR